MTNDLNARVDVVKQLTELFRLERLIYIVATAIAVLLILVIAAVTVKYHGANSENLTLLFGSTGVVGYTGNRLIVMWTKSLEVVLQAGGHDK